MSLGENLKRYRKIRGLTQSELAEKSGLKLGHISKLERDETDPKASTIEKVIKALDIPSDYLIDSGFGNTLEKHLKARFIEANNLPASDIADICRFIDKTIKATRLEEIIKGKIPPYPDEGLIMDMEKENLEQAVGEAMYVEDLMEKEQ